MAERRIRNTIYLMHLATKAYSARHHLSVEEFLKADDDHHFLRLISRCPDNFDPLPENEIVDEMEKYALRNP